MRQPSFFFSVALFGGEEREKCGGERGKGRTRGRGERERFDNNGIYSRTVTRERMNYLHVGLEKGLS
jgi:hypothetical protein